LFATQACLGLLALGLGLLTVTGMVRLWQVDLFALMLGCVSAFDAPARQSFVSELVDEAHLSNAVALNSTSFNSGRMIGPAVAGVLIAAIGTGWVFLLNAASFVGTLVALLLLRGEDLFKRERAVRRRGGFADGFRYVWAHADLRTVLLMLAVVGMFGLNFPIFISTMAVSVFHTGADGYGLLTSMMAVGSVIGALMAARREQPRFVYLLIAAAIFGAGCLLAAVMPYYWMFGAMLLIVGIAAQTFTTSTNSLVQLSTEPATRGRVLAILLAIAMGTTPIGAPIVGWIADHAGPRWALGVGGMAGIVAMLIGLLHPVPTRADASAEAAH
jgi:MFS family permease